VLTKIDVPTLAGGLNTTQPLLEKNREMFVRFLKGYLEGMQFMLRNKKRALNPSPSTSRIPTLL
jgi:hypothetical protein